MKNLLLISNISADNEQLIEYAAKFCRHYECKLHIFHMAENSSPVLVSSPRYYEEFDIEYEANNSLKISNKIVDITSKILDREFIQVKVEVGNKNKILTSFINENFIDIIVIGSEDFSGKSDFKEYKNFLMNVINTPLLVVPENQFFEPLLQFNFLTTHTKNDLKHIVKLIEIFPKSKIKLTHFVSSTEEAIDKKKSEKWVNYVKEKVGEIISYQSIECDIKEYIMNENYSIVNHFHAFVFTSHKRNLWSRLLDPSTTLGFLTSLEIPAIVFKIKKELS